MPEIKTLFACSMFFVALISCNLGAGKKNNDLREVEKAIAGSNAVYFESFAKNDSSLFLNRYSEDACIMAPFTAPACGKEGMAAFFRTAYDNYGLRNGNFVTTAVYGNAIDYVTEEGRWESVNEKGQVFDSGKFLVLWKKTKDGWKMFRDSFSSNRDSNELKKDKMK